LPSEGIITDITASSTDLNLEKRCFATLFKI